MYLINAIPLIKIPFPNPQILSYFSSKKVEKGGLVLVPLRKKDTLALAVSLEKIERKKIEIKKSDFSVQGIKDIIYNKPLMPDFQLEIVKYISQYYWSPLGLTLKTIFPAIITRYSIGKLKKELDSLNTQNRHETDPSAIDSPNLSAGQGTKKSSKNKINLLWGNNLKKNYLKEIKKAFSRNKQALFLLPEIAKAKIWQNKLEKIYPEKICFWHSDLTPKKQFESWKKIKKGEIKIIIGSRSAVFAPTTNLGLIIIDEENNESYKSWDQSPRYNAKNVAIKLGEITGARVILGTELPSVESYYLAKEKKYSLKKFPPTRSRVLDIVGTISSDNIESPRQNRDNFPHPNFKETWAGRQFSISQIIDMREEMKNGNYSIFSQELQNELKKVLKTSRQAILFINRRGYSPFIFCRDCGFVVKCRNCDSPLVYHQAIINSLVCHHCGYSEKPLTICPNCKGYKIKYFGIGTQKVSEELQKLFPEITFLRADSDTAPKQKDQEKIFKNFEDKKINVLIGTQLLFKSGGLRNISLVGILNIDTMLNFPDFRASERVFYAIHKLQNITRALPPGSSLKGSESGRSVHIIIQTYNQQNKTIQYAAKGDFESFFKEETETRKIFSYPPFSQIIKLSYQHKDPEKAKREAQILVEKLKIFLKTKNLTPDNPIDILGPAPAFIPKTKGKYRWNIVIKSKIKNFTLNRPIKEENFITKIHIKNQKYNLKLKNNLWLRNELLRMAPSDWTVDVNPVDTL